MADTAAGSLTSTSAVADEAIREPSADELRARAAARFRALAAITGDLRSEVSERARAMTDLKGQLRRHPLWILGLAGGAGLAVASLLGRTRGPRPARLAALLLGVLARRVAAGLASGRSRSDPAPRD